MTNERKEKRRNRFNRKKKFNKSKSATEYKQVKRKSDGQVSTIHTQEQVCSLDS